MDLSAARDALVQESRELIAAMEAALLDMESEGPSLERINAVFRTAHTIKGSAGLFALDLIVSFTHVMESVLDRVRNDSLPLTPDMLSTLLRSGDYLSRLIDAVEAGLENEDPDPAHRESLLATLNAMLGNEPETKETGSTSLQTTETPVERDDHSTKVSNENWHLSLRFGPDVLRMGMDPMSFIHYLGRLGRIVYLYTITDHIPNAAEFDPESCYLGFEIDLLADVDKQTLENVFEFVRDDARVRILPPRARVADYIAMIDAQPESRQRLGDILVAGGTLTQHELDEVLALQAGSAEAGQGTPRLGELLIQEQMVQAPVVAAALSKQRQGDERRSHEQRVIKVEASKLDSLINLVGELVIASAGARLLADRSKNAVLSEALGEVGGLVEQIRDRALNLRMIPIGEVFQRFPRVVRDVSQELGKKIDLIVTGADTELDKSMVEKLSDPLLHIVRNAIDHGIDSMDEREAAGKPSTGQVRLNAYHESGCIVIEIGDDGRGLDTARIRAKAIERGMIAPDASLTDAEIHQLIFAPGFSTAAEVTNLSGRGVGMDVVKRSLEQLRGEIEISSQKGVGTTFRIRLPLTLAIIDGFQVSVADSVFVIPLDMVVECADMSASSGSQRIVNLRGDPLPYLRLREVFDLPPAPAGMRESLVVVEYGHHRAGLVVDRLLGEFQAVIKPLGQLFRGVKGLGGSTILGDGSVALILDVPTLVAVSNERHEHTGSGNRLLSN
ncbi:chemotaxis protein CheA [Uliginosibacterium sp. H1]|uniref:chemotaxis protein CheA n=1 Tax=Uliginosibacterium sp. H1 TaxID=3114757 RepID=UPI002E199851|nr:chemotaxis protein CheA [Uliginosibacterium sp. H1]